jgi:hypothetical protein
MFGEDVVLTVQKAVGLILRTLERLGSDVERDRCMTAVQAIGGRQLPLPGVGK